MRRKVTIRCVACGRAMVVTWPRLPLLCRPCARASPLLPVFPAEPAPPRPRATVTVTVTPTRGPTETT